MTLHKILLVTFLAAQPWMARGETKSYLVGVEDFDYYPYFSFLDDETSKEYVGFGRELLDLFAAKSNLSLTYKPMPVTRLNQSYLQGRIHFRFPDNPRWATDMKKDKPITYSKVIHKRVNGLMILPENRGKLKIEDLKRIGTIRGFTPPEAYQQRIRDGKLLLEETNEFVQLLQMALRGRINAAYLDPEVADYLLNFILLKPGVLVFDPSLPYVQADYHLSSIDQPDIIRRFDQFLIDEKESIDQIKAKSNIKNWNEEDQKFE